MTKFMRIALALSCVVVFAFGVAACGSSGGTTSTVTKTVEEQNDNHENDNHENDNNENDNNENDNQNQNGNESVSKQKKECLKHNKGYPENCSNIP